MIDLIYFDKIIRGNYNVNSNRLYISDLTKLNIFSGTNNSGKSMFLRHLASNTEGFVQFNLSLIDDYNIKTIREKFIDGLERLRMNYSYDQNERLFLNELIFNVEEISDNAIHDLLKQMIDVEDFRTSVSPELLFDDATIKRFENFANDLITNNIVQNNVQKIYIPTLRGLRPIHKSSELLAGFSNMDVYRERTLLDYFPKSKTNSLIVATGLSIYEEIKKLLLGTTEERKLIGDFELFLKEHIFDVNVTLIPKYDQDVLNIKLGNDEQLPIYNLGDGLQSIIAILFPIFIRRDLECEFFIEEPETHLHPHWQLKLLGAMLAMPNAQYFVTTHATAFMNNSKSTILRFQKDEKGLFNIDQISDGDKTAELIADLGYKPSDLLLSNFNIWVEGPSDKIYVNHIIKELGKNLIEGKDYSILILGGENYRNWFDESEDNNMTCFESINKNYMVILDSDKKSKTDQLSAVKQKLKDDNRPDSIWITERREIENYIETNTLQESAKKILMAQSVEIDFGNYSNVTCVKITNNQVDYNSTIKLDSTIMKRVKANKGSTKGIKANELRSVIEGQLIKENKSNLHKVKLAKYISKHYSLEAYDEELVNKVRKIIRRINEINRFIC